MEKVRLDVTVMSRKASVHEKGNRLPPEIPGVLLIIRAKLLKTRAVHTDTRWLSFFSTV